MADPFRIGVTRDFLRPNGTLGFGDIGLGLLDAAPNVAWEFLPEDTTELRPDQIQPYDGLLVLAPRVTAATLACSSRLAIVARFGVGYDSIDVDACTQQGVLLTITPDGVRRPVAVAALTLLLACSHKLLIKDRLTRTGRWSEKLSHMGQGVTGRTIGILGLGNIGREIVTLARPLGMTFLGYDPYLTEPVDGVACVSLEELLKASDYVCICCALTPETHHLLNDARLSQMKRTAYLINVARGPIVDQHALTVAIREGRLAGAGLDVFEQEPIANDDPLLSLENVILTPHALCWTDECFLGNGRSACNSLLEVAAGRMPRTVVNRDVLEHPKVRARLR